MDTENRNPPGLSRRSRTSRRAPASIKRLEREVEVEVRIDAEFGQPYVTGRADHLGTDRKSGGIGSDQIHDDRRMPSRLMVKLQCGPGLTGHHSGNFDDRSTENVLTVDLLRSHRPEPDRRRPAGPSPSTVTTWSGHTGSIRTHGDPAAFRAPITMLKPGMIPSSPTAPLSSGGMYMV